MQTSGINTLVVFSHSAAIIALMLPLLILSGSFNGGHNAEATTSAPNQTFVESLSF